MSFQLTILGSSSALPTSNRYPTAQALHVLGRFFLIDCGEGTQTQLRKYRIGFSRINHIFITHLHGDHIFGLIGLISTFILLGRDTELHIYSHPDLKKYINAQLRFLYPGEITFKLVFHPLEYESEQLIYEDKKVLVYSFPLSHRIPTCGFRFEEKAALPNLRPEKLEEYKIPIRDRQRIKEGGDFITAEGNVIPHAELTINHYQPRSFAFCSDTRYDEAYIDSVKNVDLLYHEATFASDNQELATHTYHSTGKDAATVAQKAGVEKLLIGHFSARYKDHTPILEEAVKIFSNTMAIAEGDVIEVERKKVQK